MKRIPLYISILIFLLSCNDTGLTVVHDGNWLLRSAKQNNVTTRMLDGAYIKFANKKLQSNLVNQEQPTGYTIQSSSIVTEQDEVFLVKEYSDSLMIIEVIKHRNLFELELVRQQ